MILIRVALALLAASTLLPGQVVVTPRTATLLSGQTLAFRVSLAEGGTLVQPGGEVVSLRREAWLWTLPGAGAGSLDAVTGRYRAPEVLRPCTVKIRASYRSRPEVSAEASLLVLPFEPFQLVDQVMGPGWLEPFSSDLPFLTPCPGLRYRPQSQVQTWEGAWRLPVDRHYAGYGIPFTLRWQAKEGAEAQLLTYLEAHEPVVKDVSGRDTMVITCKGQVRDFRVEALQRVVGLQNTWRSHVQHLQVRLRGLLPYAGNGLMAPEHRDGKGLAARFRQAFGVALVATKVDTYKTYLGCLVTDPESHCIRMVSSMGEVSTPWGQPGRAGHRDVGPPSCLRRLMTALGLNSCLEAPPGPSLFKRPTFLCSGPAPLLRREDTWQRVLVSDSGNHVIRRLAPDGSVLTLAGTPGLAGHRDAYEGAEALFNNPQGLAEDPNGNLYVADQGNGVIRCLSPAGRVYTVAGSPGVFGSRDGVGQQASFTKLSGLAWSALQDHGAALYVVDGHAIRRISLPGGLVETVLGVVATPGFREVQGDTLASRRSKLLAPCLSQPCGLLATSQGLAIADSGNHAVRSWSVREDTLVTVVGGPRLGETRWGLVRDGLEDPLDERFAALEAPRTMAAMVGEPLVVVVSTANCLGTLCSALEERDWLLPVRLKCSSAALDQPCSVRFMVEAHSRSGFQSLRPIQYTVDFLEPDGTLAERLRGTGDTYNRIAAQGLFSQRGQGTVIVRCVTDQGVSSEGRRTVVIR